MRTVLAALVIFAAATFLSAMFMTHVARAGEPDHEFSVKEYEDFHDVLHPLEHEALPQKDFARIRAKAVELVGLGEIILKLGVPRGVDEKYTADFKQELKKFSDALARFKSDAETGTDEKLKESYSAVHDSFEMLAAMLPRTKQK